MVPDPISSTGITHESERRTLRARRLLLGAVGIWFHDFALQWQAVPGGIPMRTPLAYLSGALLVAGGGAILSRQYERAGALLLAVFYGLWVIAFHLPNALRRRSSTSARGTAPAEITFSRWARWRCCPRMPGRCAARWHWWRACWPALSAVVFGVCAFQLHRLHGHHGAGVDPAFAGVLGLGHGCRSPRGRPRAGQRHSGAPRGHVARGHDGFVRAARCTFRASSASPEKHEEWIMLAVSSALTGAAWLVRKYAT